MTFVCVVEGHMLPTTLGMLERPQISGYGKKRIKSSLHKDDHFVLSIDWKIQQL